MLRSSAFVDVVTSSENGLLIVIWAWAYAMCYSIADGWATFFRSHNRALLDVIIGGVISSAW